MEIANRIPQAEEASLRPCATLFQAQRGVLHQDGAEADMLEQALQTLCARGRAAWPEIDLATEAFVKHVAEVLPQGDVTGASLSEVFAEDLFLAAACRHGVPHAMASFEKYHLAQIPAFVSRMSLSAATVDEVKQQVCEKLFVASGEAPPKIVTYSGRGPLRTWLRVVAVRTALNLQRGQVKPAEESSLQALAAEGNVELEYIKARYKEEFTQALKDAFVTLTSKQRNILRLSHLSGMTDEKIGALFKVHQSTATRWLAAAREAVLMETKRLLRQRLRISDAEFESLMVVVQSQLDLSVSGLLRDQTG